VDLALAGHRVVRLKGGDPSIFARTGEEVEACRDAGVPVRIVPGVTTASAAAASLGGSLTHRDHAQRVQFVTAHDRHGDLPEELNLGALTDPKATTVVYMGRRTASKLAARLIDNGLPPDTPVAAVCDVSRPTQEQLETTIFDIAHGITLPGNGPLIILIGASVRPARETTPNLNQGPYCTVSAGRPVKGLDERLPALPSSWSLLSARSQGPWCCLHWDLIKIRNSAHHSSADNHPEKCHLQNQLAREAWSFLHGLREEKERLRKHYTRDVQFRKRPNNQLVNLRIRCHLSPAI
jgi:siroheme synthase